MSGGGAKAAAAGGAAEAITNPIKAPGAIVRVEPGARRTMPERAGNPMVVVAGRVLPQSMQRSHLRQGAVHLRPIRAAVAFVRRLLAREGGHDPDFRVRNDA